MKQKAKLILGGVYFAFFIGMATMRSAYAYIDPATTSYLLQIVAGVFIAVGATVAIFWRKIAMWFKKKNAQRARKAKQRREGK